MDSLRMGELAARTGIGVEAIRFYEREGLLPEAPRTASGYRLLALIGGAPAIAGAWIGGLLYSQALSTLFLAIGAGAVLQVAYQIGKQMVWKGSAERQRPWAALTGVLTGMLMLYLTGLAIK